MRAPTTNNLRPHQSMVQQFTSEGNILNRVRKASPMGLRHRTTCRFVRARSMKKAYTSLGEPVLIPAACTTSEHMCVHSKNVRETGSKDSHAIAMRMRLPRHLWVVGVFRYGCQARMTPVLTTALSEQRNKPMCLAYLFFPSYLRRFCKGLVDSHHLLIVEKTRHFTSVQNAVHVFQKCLVDKLGIVQQEHRGPRSESCRKGEELREYL